MMIYSVLHYQDSSRFVKHTFLKSTFVSEMPQIHTVLITYRIYSYCGDFILMRSNDKLNGLISLIAVEDKYTLKYPIFEKVHTLTLINFMKLTQIGYLRTDYSIHKGLKVHIALVSSATYLQLSRLDGRLQTLSDMTLFAAYLLFNYILQIYS